MLKSLNILFLLFIIILIAPLESLAEDYRCIEGMEFKHKGRCTPAETAESCTTRGAEEPHWCCCDKVVEPEPEPEPNKECIKGMLKVYEGKCRSLENKSDQCTTRGINPFWCCCEEDYIVSVNNDPLGSICSISLSANKTTMPKKITNSLYKIRDDILLKDQTGKIIVKKYYIYSDEIQDILSKNPSLVIELAEIMDEYKEYIFNYARNKQVKIDKKVISKVDIFLSKLKKHSNENRKLKKFFSKSKELLNNDEFLNNIKVFIN